MFYTVICIFKYRLSLFQSLQKYKKQASMEAFVEKLHKMGKNILFTPEMRIKLDWLSILQKGIRIIFAVYD